MQDAPKAVWSISSVSVAFFPSLKHNFIAYPSSKVSDCIFEIPQLWQSGFSRMYSNCCCSCSFEPEIIKIGQSSHKLYSNNILNFQESTPILNARTKKVWQLIICPLYVKLKHPKPFPCWFLPELLREFDETHLVPYTCGFVLNLLSWFGLLYSISNIIFTQPLRSGRIWHKVNFLSGV